MDKPYRPTTGPGSRGGSRAVVRTAVRNYGRRVGELEETLERLRDLYRRRSAATHVTYYDSPDVVCVSDCPRCAAEEAVWEALAGV